MSRLHVNSGCFVLLAPLDCDAAPGRTIPPAWEILLIPRYVECSSPIEFLTLGKVAIVRRDVGPYQTVRDRSKNLVGKSTVVAGALEWHGFHYPLATDTLKAHAVCCESALHAMESKSKNRTPLRKAVFKGDRASALSIQALYLRIQGKV